MAEKDTQLQDILAAIKNRITYQPKIAVILGSGLGGFADELQDQQIIPTEELPGYPVSTVPGHRGNLVFGKTDGVDVLAVQGRIHYYEGYTFQQVTLPVRVAHGLGAQVLMVTNASGGISQRLKPGDLMLIDDHVNLMGASPLIGLDPPDEASRFADMGDAYSRDLKHLAEEVAMEQGVPLKHGILGSLTGPSYETPAEVQMLSTLGCHAACMSTVPEVIVAKSLGLKVVGISCVTNKAAGLSENPLNHAEVQEIAAKVAPVFRKLLKGIIVRIARQHLG